MALSYEVRFVAVKMIPLNLYKYILIAEFK